MTPDAESTKRETGEPRRDTLTIGRFLLLTAGVAVGLGVFVSAERKGGPFHEVLNLEGLLVYCYGIRSGHRV